MPTKQRKINERMNLTIPVYDGAGSIYAYVHNEPISREMFEAHFLILSKTFAAIHTEGLGDAAGPRVSAMMLKRIAARNHDEESATSLLNEIRRLSNVLYRTPTGWDNIPYQNCIDDEMLDLDDVSEVENAIVFFTCSWHMHRKSIAKDILDGAVKLWGASITSSTLSEFHGSLKVSKKADTSGESPELALSAPY